MTFQPPLRILCLDGGGVKGLSSLYIVRDLMSQIRRNQELGLRQKHNAPLRPCDYFDLICGTGTGGLIAIMLGRLQYDIDKAIQEYIILSTAVFETGSSDDRALFDAATLEIEMRRVIKASPKGFKEDDMFEDSQVTAKSNICRTFVLASRPEGLGKAAVRMRSYATVDNDPFQAQIWQVARATSAAPTYFLPIEINSMRYGDSRVGWNNPTMEAINEANYVWPGRPIACVVSAGTGLEDAIQLQTESKASSISEVWGQLFRSLNPRQAFELAVAQYCVSCVTSCERTHVQVASNLARFGIDSPWQYVRLNVPQGMGKIGLQEWKKFQMIAAMTKDYMEDIDVQELKRRVAEILASPEYSSIPISAPDPISNKVPQGRIAYPPGQRQIEARNDYAKNIEIPSTSQEGSRSNALVRQQIFPSRQQKAHLPREYSESSSDESGTGRRGQIKRSKFDVQGKPSQIFGAANLGRLRLPPVKSPSPSANMSSSQHSTGKVSSSSNDLVSLESGSEFQKFTIYPESDILSTLVLCCDYPQCTSMGALQKGYLRDHYMTYHDELLIKPSVMIPPQDTITNLRSLRCSACLRKLTEENRRRPCGNCRRFDPIETSFNVTLPSGVNNLEAATPSPQLPDIVGVQKNEAIKGDMSDSSLIKDVGEGPSSQPSFWTPPEIPEHWSVHAPSSPQQVNANTGQSRTRPLSHQNLQSLPASVRKAREEYRRRRLYHENAKN